MAKDKYENYTHAQLIAELKKLSKRKKYGLVWEEEKTKEKFEADAEGKLPVLVEDKKREIKTLQTKHNFCGTLIAWTTRLLRMNLQT